MTDLAPTPSASMLSPALTHVMDARLHNLDQEVLVFDPSPDVDSAMEHAAALLSCPDRDRPRHVGELLRLLRQIVESNRCEGGHELSAAGIIDPLVKTLHTSGRRSSLTAKDGAARLRAPLQVIANRPDGIAFFHQACRIKDVVAVMDDHVIRGAGMRKALGPNRHDLLLSLLPAAEEAAA